MRGLSKSQVRAFWAMVSGPLLAIASWIALHETDIEQRFPNATWIPLIFPVYTTFYVAFQRSLAIRRSGTGQGIALDGTDDLAAKAQGTGGTPGTPYYSPEEQAVVDSALELFFKQKQEAAAQTKAILSTAYGLSAAKLAEGHAAIAEGASAAPSAPSTDVTAERPISTDNAGGSIAAPSPTP